MIVSAFVGRSINDSNPVENFFFYVPVYVIGMAVSHYRNQVMPLLARYSPVLILAIALPLIGLYTDPWLDNIEFVTKVIFCLGLTGLFFRFSRQLPSWIDYLGSISFGIYFVHYYVVAVLTIASKSLLHDFFSGGLGAYTVTLLIVLVPSVAVVTIIKRVMGRYSRMIIGA